MAQRSHASSVSRGKQKPKSWL